MALFGFGKSSAAKAKEDKKEENKEVLKTETVKAAPKKTETKKVSKSTSAKTSATNLTGIILRPRITEKATILAEEGNVYTFDIDPRTTKKEVSKAVETHFKVRPVKVNITDIKSKTVLRRGKKGKKAGGKKAMVYLKRGDKIEFV